MCGIAGIINFQKKVEKNDLIKMTNAIKHRGPDGEGHWINNKGNVGFGHRRLSIIDLSDDGHQPMHYSNNRYVITYNGEVYNYLELKKILEQKNYKFHSKTDTEVILAAYDCWGKDCVKKFDGMFAFAIWDELKKELFCARDRFGEKPFYYYKDKDYFVFASEMKALWAIDIEKQPLRQKVFNYFIYNTITNPNNQSETFFKSIYQLKPSHTLNVKRNLVVEDQYWEINLNLKTRIPFEKASSQFIKIFENSIQKRMRSDVEVGSSLSGGLDSSSIVCTIKKLYPNLKFNTFSAVFPGYEKDESKYINSISNHTGFDNYKIKPDSNSFLDELEKISYHQEEPFGSASIASQFQVFKLAKENNTTVLLDGQGADEILAGYPGMWISYLKQLLKYDYLRFKIIHKQLQSNQNLAPQNIVTLAQHTFFKNSTALLGDIRRSHRKYNDAIFMGLAKDLVNEHKKNKNPIYKPHHLKTTLKNTIFKRGLNELLRYADRNAMAHGIETRLPFLNHNLVEFLFSLPDEYIINKGWSKYILRKSMSNIIPPEVIWRKDKIGYETPQENWFEEPKLKEKLNSSIDVLIKNKIVEKPDSRANWKYLMIGKLYE